MNPLKYGEMLTVPRQVPNFQSEAQLLLQIKKVLTILKHRGELTFRRIHVMPIQVGQFRTRPNKDMRGLEDLQVYLPNGKTLYWELKTKTKQTDVQKQREAELKRFGHDYCIIRSLDEAIEELSSYGVNVNLKGVKDGTRY